jgi:hypothetical protein
MASNQFRPNFGETSNPSPQLYRRGGTRPKAPRQMHRLADVCSYWSCNLSARVARNRLENRNELCQPPIIRLARRTITVGIDPLRMLRHQIPMQLFLQISISPNLTPVRPQLSEPSLSRPCIHNQTRSRSAHAPTTAHWKDLLLHHQWGCGLPLLDDALKLLPVARPIRNQHRRFIQFELGRADQLLRWRPVCCAGHGRSHGWPRHQPAIFR